MTTSEQELVAELRRGREAIEEANFTANTDAGAIRSIRWTAFEEGVMSKEIV